MYTPNISHPALKILFDSATIHKAIAGKEKTICRYNDETIDLTKESKKTLDDITRNLGTEIDVRIQNEVKTFKGRYILLVGKSIMTSEAVGSYLYCTKGHTALNYYSFSGETDERTENILNDSVYYNGEDKLRDGKLVDCLSSGGTVFLGNLECHDRPFLKRLASEIGNVKRQYRQGYNKGMLIVSTTTSIDSVPDYFKELFEIIELKPEKQNKM